MDILEFKAVAEAMPQVGTVLLASQWEANKTIARLIKEEGFPLILISEKIPSVETAGIDGFSTSLYLPEMMFLDFCKHDDDYLVKHQIQRQMRSLVRKVLYQCNKEFSMKKTGLYIKKANIGNMIDTDFDDNLVGCLAIMEIPDLDLTQSIC